MFFSINFSDSFRSTGRGQGAGNIFESPKIIFPENDLLKCAYYFFCINKIYVNAIKKNFF